VAVSNQTHSPTSHDSSVSVSWMGGRK